MPAPSPLVGYGGRRGWGRCIGLLVREQAADQLATECVCGASEDVATDRVTGGVACGGACRCASGAGRRAGRCITGCLTGIAHHTARAGVGRGGILRGAAMLTAEADAYHGLQRVALEVAGLARELLQAVGVGRKELAHLLLQHRVAGIDAELREVRLLERLAIVETRNLILGEPAIERKDELADVT